MRYKGRSHTNQDGGIVRVECENGGGIRGEGDIDIKRIDPNVLDILVPPMSFSALLRYRLRRCEKSASLDTQPLTYWYHNGSTIYLAVNGSSRQFIYENPRPGMLEAGAKKGSLLFTGLSGHNTYDGTAFIFRGHCGQFSYHVTGPILEEGRKVVLHGEAPRVNDQCKVTGHMADTLEFGLIDSPNADIPPPESAQMAPSGQSESAPMMQSKGAVDEEAGH